MSRLIDADALLKKKDIITINDGNRASVVGIVYEDDIEEAPTVDAVTVVRCKECLYWDEEIKWMPEQFDYICKCILQDRWTEDDEFCSDGTKKEKEDETRENMG